MVNGTKAPTGNEQGKLVSLAAEQLQTAIVAARTESGLLSNHLMKVVDIIASANGEQGNDNLAAAAESVNRLMHGLQFIDRFSQQVNNVRINLKALGNFLEKEPQHARGPQWEMLLQQARNTYSMQAERDMFDAVFGNRFAGAVPDTTVIFDVTIDDD